MFRYQDIVNAIILSFHFFNQRSTRTSQWSSKHQTLDKISVHIKRNINFKTNFYMGQECSKLNEVKSPTLWHQNAETRSTMKRSHHQLLNSYHMVLRDLTSHFLNFLRILMKYFNLKHSSSLKIFLFFFWKHKRNCGNDKRNNTAFFNLPFLRRGMTKL